MVRTSPDSAPVAASKRWTLTPDTALPPSVPTMAWPAQQLGARFRGEAARRRRDVCAHVDDRRDPAARLGERSGGPIGAVIVGEDHRLVAGNHAELVGVALGRARQHDARPVVAGKYQRPFEGAGRQHDGAGADRPVAVARLALAGDAPGGR